MKNEEKRKLELEEAYNSILQKVKSWNKDRILLSWSFGVAVVLTSGFNMFQQFYQKYNFNLKQLSDSFPDYYMIGLFIFFIFGGYIAFKTGTVIDQHSNDLNATLETIRNELSKIKQKSIN